MNETIIKFGYPETCILEYKHWVVLVRPEQVTLGSLILAAKSDATNLGSLSPDEWAEFSVVSKEAETLLSKKLTFSAEKFNYLALMMVDPHVHFHLIPRYSKEVMFLGMTFKDPDWPLPTKLIPMDLDPETFKELVIWLKGG